jgi:hypothetical protein
VSPMFKEIEDILISLLREKLAGIPKDNVIVDDWPSKPPAVRISNLKFKIQNADMAEDMDMGKVEIEERIDGDGVKRSFRLQEKPLKNSVRVESPPGMLLSEKDDYAVDYINGSIEFSKVPAKGKSKLVRYFSQKSVMKVKSLKLKALYCFDVWGSNSVEADSLAEEIVKTLITAEDRFLKEEIELKPLGGIFIIDNDQAKKIRLRYLLEKEMRIEQIVGPIEKIEITNKNF